LLGRFPDKADKLESCIFIREQRCASKLLCNEWLVRQVAAPKTTWGNYGFCCSPNDKIANSVSKSSFGSASGEQEKPAVAAVGAVVRPRATRLDTTKNAIRIEFQISHPPWQVSQRSRRTRYCRADWR
jgi:hypothetical protein